MSAALKHLKTKNLKMRQLWIQSMVCFLLSAFGFSSQAQTFAAQMLQQMPVNLVSSSGSPYVAGYLPVGATVSMENPYISYNSLNQVDVHASLVNYFVANGINPNPSSGMDNYIPVQLMSSVGPSFTPGQMVFLPYSHFDAPGAVRVIDDSDDEPEGRYCARCNEPVSRDNTSQAVANLQHISTRAIAPESRMNWLSGTAPNISRGTQPMSSSCNQIMNQRRTMHSGDSARASTK
jgi:hypothetical protein